MGSGAMTETGSDYGDYEVETFTVSLRNDESSDNTDGNIKSSAAFDFEPLTGAGGLDTNEVAELVYLEVYAKVEHEDRFNDQNVGTSTELRGSVGINLPAQTQALIDTGSDPIPNLIEGEVFEVIDTDTPDDTIQAIGGSQTDDRYLQHFTAVGGPPFDDVEVGNMNGAGGNNYSSVWHSEKHMRDIFGRGPVIDSQDNLTVLVSLTGEDYIIQIAADVKVMAVWDTAETEDSGRRFSVPR